MSTRAENRAAAAHHKVAAARRFPNEALLLVPAVIFVVATVVYPLLYNISQSFFDIGIAEIVSGAGKWVGFENYADQLQRPEFWAALGISVSYTAATVVLSVIVALLLAQLFQLNIPGRDYMRALILLAWIIPTVISANVWRWLLDGSYGLLNGMLRMFGIIDGDVFWLGEPVTAFIAVVAASVWTFAPLGMILLTAGLQSIPHSLYEAAMVDGASRWQRFLNITVPALKPVLYTTAFLLFIYTFKTFDTIFLMTGGGPGGATKILPVYAYEQAFIFFKFGKAAVATTILLVIPTVLSILYFHSIKKEERS